MNRKTEIFTKVIALALILSLSISLFGCVSDKPQDLPDEPQNSDGVQNEELPDFELIWGKVAFPGEYSKERDTVVDYAYSDGYFEMDSTLYNPSLSTMSLCLELSSWASYETEVWAEKTQNAKKLLEEIGFTEFAQNDYWSDKPSIESVGVVAAHKELEGCTLIALPVRGGKYYNEWGSNVALGLEGEHTGFAEGRDHVIEFLEEYIISHDITGRVKIWLVGYSRGGAIANMVAGYLNTHGLPNGATLAFNDLYCYAFEPPQGSLEEMTGSDENHLNIHNIVNVNDIVTMVAPTDWGFARYNHTSRLLPTVTTVGFESALEVMLEEYAEVLQGAAISDPSATEYNISEYAKKIEVSVNPLRFLPGGEPFVEINIVDDQARTMNEVLSEFITYFAESVHGREAYNTSLEADLVYLLDQIMGYESTLDPIELMTGAVEALTANNNEKLIYVLSPVFELGFLSAEDRIDKVVSRLHEVLPQPEGFTDLYGTAVTLLKAAGTLIVNHPQAFLDVVLAFTNTKLMQSHYEEITLAWLRAGDPNYTDRPYTMEVPQTLRTVRVNCPVNVEVYDSNGTLVASIIDRVCTSYSGVIGCTVNSDGEIVVYLPSDAEYSIVTKAFDEGEVNITLSEYNVVHNKATRVQNYENIPVVEGDVLTLDAPNFKEDEYKDRTGEGSTTEYTLVTDEGEKIDCREDKGEDVEFFDIEVDTNNSFGIVTGGGEYMDGTFAKVNALPVAGSNFIGWYVGDELVSSESEYRFAVDCDLLLTAHFEQVETYKMTFSTSGGEGRVLNSVAYYPAGSTVEIRAEGAEGYEFSHWEALDGVIEKIAAANTTFVMPSGDVEIVAVFKIGICPACGKTLDEGRAHGADCKTEGHYECDGLDHSEAACEKSGHNLCDGGDHSAAVCGIAGHFACDKKDHSSVRPCGHFGCEGGEHGSLACGHYRCQGGEHQMLDCGHYACAEGNHEKLLCGYYACDGKEHQLLNCGHCSCSAGEHGLIDCGHYACTEGNHEKLPCGHYGCSEGDHSELSCYHYACDGKSHQILSCGHSACIGEDHDPLTCGKDSDNVEEDTLLDCGHYSSDSGEHYLLDCGHYSCSGGDHSELSCYHYACDGNNHEILSCGHPACIGEDHDPVDCVGGSQEEEDPLECGHYPSDGGEHYMLACGSYSCDGRVHEILECSHCSCAEGEHWMAKCGHFVCDGNDHDIADCGHFACESYGHELLECGHYNCDGGAHDLAECGNHYYCDGGEHWMEKCGHFTCDEGEHGFLSCGHMACDDTLDHSLCEYCYYYLCEGGDHGDGICNTGGDPDVETPDVAPEG